MLQQWQRHYHDNQLRYASKYLNKPLRSYINMNEEYQTGSKWIVIISWINLIRVESCWRCQLSPHIIERLSKDVIWPCDEHGFGGVPPLAFFALWGFRVSLPTSGSWFGNMLFIHLGEWRLNGIDEILNRMGSLWDNCMSMAYTPCSSCLYRKWVSALSYWNLASSWPRNVQSMA